MPQWYYLLSDGEHEHGPISDTQLKALAYNGTIDRQTHVRRETDGDWSAAGQVKGLFREPFSTPQMPEPQKPIHPTRLLSELNEAMAPAYLSHLSAGWASSVLAVIAFVMFLASGICFLASVNNDSDGAMAAAGGLFLAGVMLCVGYLIIRDVVSILAIIAVELRLIRKQLTRRDGEIDPNTAPPGSASPTLR